MFSYEDLLNEINLFCRYGVETGNVGNSETGLRIPYVFVGKKNGNYMIVQAAIHAREHLSSLLCVNLAKFLVKNSQLNMYGGIFFVPMVNPDGVELCREGLGFLSKNIVTGKFANGKKITAKHKKNVDNSTHIEDLRSRLLAANNGSEDFSLWKANVDGVDLNVNFDADWGQGAQNVFSPAPQNYVGERPFSACETRALARFTEAIRPLVTLSYHLKGEEIYWDFGQESHRRRRDFRYAEAISRYTGYKIVDRGGSVGGYKDWCVEKFKIPSFTVEVGNDEFSHPFPYSQLQKIYSQNKDLPRLLLNTVVRDKRRLDEAGIGDVMK